MKTITIRILYFFLCFCASSIVAQVNYIDEILYYKDTQDTLTITSAPQAQFAPLHASIGFNDSPFWFKIQLKTPAKTESIYLEIKETFLKSIQLYNAAQKQLYHNDTINDTKLTIPIIDSTQILYAKVRFDKHPYINISAYEMKHLATNNTTTLLQRGGYYTLILIFVILNIFLSYFFKERLFLWYILFFLSVNLGIALYDNTIAALVKNTTHIHYLLAFEYWITPIAAAIFCIRFLQIQRFYPKIVTLTKVLLTIITVLILIFLFTNNYTVIAITQLINLSIYMGSWIIGFFLLKRVPSAKYYVLGYFVLYFSALLYSLSVNFGLHFFPLTIEHLKIGIIIEIIVLTYAVMKRAQKILEENELVKAEVLTYIQELQQHKNKAQQTTFAIEDKLILEAQKHQLTDRETDVLIHLARGLNNQEIANELFVSINTVKYHTRNIYEKFDIKKRTEITSKLLFNK